MIPSKKNTQETRDSICIRPCLALMWRQSRAIVTAVAMLTVSPTAWIGNEKILNHQLDAAGFLFSNSGSPRDVRCVTGPRSPHVNVVRATTASAELSSSKNIRRTAPNFQIPALAVDEEKRRQRNRRRRWLFFISKSLPDTSSTEATRRFLRPRSNEIHYPVRFNYSTSLFPDWIKATRWTGLPFCLVLFWRSIWRSSAKRHSQ